MVLFLGTTLFAEEVSVFGAGSITSDNPYGLTENEQVLLANKKRVDSIENQFRNQQEEMIGLRSVVEGSTSQMTKLESRVSDLEIRTTGRVSNLASPSVSVATKDDIEALKRDIAELKSQIDALNKKLGIQGSVKKNLIEPEKPVAQVSVKQEPAKQVATKDEPKNQVLNEKASAKKDVAEKEATKKETPKEPAKGAENPVKKVIGFDDMKPEEIESIAKSLFEEKKYTESKIHYDYLSTKNYKPGLTNYMIGEIYFNQKSYANAVKSYQTSLSKDDKASYIPQLLYHSGLSLENLGDKSNSEKFFTVLKTQYPDSPQAKLLQK